MEVEVLDARMPDAGRSIPDARAISSDTACSGVQGF